MPPAFTEAAILAAANEAVLTLYSVVPEPPRLQRLLRLGTKKDTLHTLVADERRARLSALRVIRRRKCRVQQLGRSVARRLRKWSQFCFSNLSTPEVTTTS